MQFDGALQNGHIDKGQQVIGVPCAIGIDQIGVETAGYILIHKTGRFITKVYYYLIGR